MEVKTKMTARILVLALMMLMALGLMPGGLLLPAAVAVEPGVPDAPTRAQVSSLRFIEAETNYLGGIALDSNGYVWTWGYNAYGMLGTGKSVGDYAGGMARVPYFMDNNIKIVQVEGGYHTNYALDDQGVLYAWGRGLEGQMGNYTTSINNNTPQIVTSLEGIKIKKVATTTEAASATFAIDVDGNVYAWGYADGYRINGWSGYQREARRMPEFDAYNVVDIVLGNQHGIVLDSAGQIYTWGYNTSGQLGHGNRTLQQTPVQVSFFSGMVVKGISAEFNTSMAVTSDGRAWTWGTNYEATATSRMTSYTSAGGGTYNYWPSGRENQILTPEWIQFDLSSSPYNTVAPPIATVTAGRYTSYLTDVYGRVWVIGWNVHYGLLTDGPLFTTTNGGKHSVYVKDATLIRTLGDGDTQGYLNEPAGPVFSGATSTSNFLAQYNSYNRFGQWSQMGDGLHPTIYDKKYMNTTDSGDPRSHTYDYPLDALGRRLVYVIRRESASPITYGGNFYVAEPGYSGPWCVNNSSRTDLPAGVTTVTSVPSVKSEEQGWINLVVDVDSFDYTGGYLKELPYIKQITTYQSQVLFLDNAGNLYKQSFDGSGSIAWGWDYGKYEIGTAGNNAARGLYNFYFYELMYMRGAPTADFTDIDAQRASSKIYLVEDAEGNTPVDTVTISAKVPPIVTSAALNLSLEPELTELRYLFIPYDETNSYFGMTSFSDSEFNAAASSGLYQTGSLLTPGATYKDGNYTFSVNIPNNGKLWLLIGDSLYGSVSYHSYIYLADNFYTPIEAMHRGVEEENPPGRQVYAPTAENVVKTSTDPAGVKPAQPPVYYGLPLDVNGNVISDPSYGYDEISITKLAVLPNGLDDRWEFITPQDETVVYELDNASFVTYDAGGVLTPFVHEFYYLFTGFPILTSDKSVTDENGDGYASPGETLTYVITIGNVGTAPGEDILVKDTLEDILPYVNDPSGNVVTIENDGVLSTVTVQDLIDGFEIPEVVDATVATITFSVKVKTSFDAGAVTKLFNQAEVGDTDPPAAEIETLGVFKDADVLRISELTDLITYTIRFRMPADVTAYESVRIVDIIPDALRYAVGSATLSIGGAAGTAVPVAAAGNILYCELGGAAFEGAAGKWVQLSLGFTTEEWAGGTVTNTAALYFKPKGGAYPDEPSVVKEKEIEESVLSKIATLGQYEGMYTPGDDLDYTFSETLPNDLAVFSKIEIIDVYDAGKLSYQAGSAVLSIDGAVLSPSLYMIVDNGAGVLTVTIDKSVAGAYDFSGDAGKAMVLRLTFLVDFHATEKIQNIGKVVYDGKVGGGDREEVVVAIGPPTDAEEYAGNEKTALLWDDPLDEEAKAFQIRIDNGEWVTYQRNELTLDSAAGKWYLLFQRLPNGDKLVNYTEYTFHIRAINSLGLAGAAVEIKSTPDPLGDIGGREADLLSIHKVSVVPSGGWVADSPAGYGMSASNPFKATISIDAFYTLSSIHQNNLSASTDATLILYADRGFTQVVTWINRVNETTDPVSWLDEVHVYVRIMSGNTQNIRYYDITVLPKV